MNRTTWRFGQTARAREQSHNDLDPEDEQNTLKCKQCGYIKMSNQNMLKVHKIAGKENRSDV